MSAPAYVVFPVEGDGAQTMGQDGDQGAKIASAIQQSINGQMHPEGRRAEQQTQTEHGDRNGPLKAMIDNNRRSFYRYISWEDPLRTLSSYVGILSILLIAHYLPFTHLALKAGAITLGAIAAMEGASRAFGPDTFLARLRPKPYKTIPEDTLNATLKDIHDFIQFSVSEAQKIVFAQDLDKTVLTAAALGTAFFVSKMMSPFSFSILALTTVYVGSLAASSAPSEKGRVSEVAKRATGMNGQSTDKQSAHSPPAFPVTLKEEANQTHRQTEAAHPEAAYPVSLKEEVMGSRPQFSESGVYNTTGAQQQYNTTGAQQQYGTTGAQQQYGTTGAQQ